MYGHPHYLSALHTLSAELICYDKDLTIGPKPRSSAIVDAMWI